MISRVLVELDVRILLQAHSIKGNPIKCHRDIVYNILVYPTVARVHDKLVG
jgi:hypothetical protein